MSLPRHFPAPVSVTAKEPAAAPRPENRREPRHPAHGSVEFSWSDPVLTKVRGTLVDISNSGFRARHTHLALEAGTIVDFTHPEQSGKARVVWSRLQPASGAHSAHAESGFLIIE
ncbi:MAG: PilZ domain-containing protein [Bryobacteraceae bacterium]